MRGVIDPELGDNVVDLGMYRSADIDDDGNVIVHLALTTAGCPLRAQLQQRHRGTGRQPPRGGHRSRSG